MDSLRLTTAAAVMAGMLAAATQTASAQTARSGGGANAQLMQQMQQLASERTSLQAENAKLKKDLEDVRKDRDALKSAQQALEARTKASANAVNTLKESLAQHESTDRELAQTKEKMQQLISKFKETLQTLREVETENTTTKQTLTARDQSLKTCVDRNQALYQLNQEVLTHFEHQSVWTRVAQAEPFTRIKRNQLENLVDEYESRADGQHIIPTTSPIAPGSAPSQPHSADSSAGTNPSPALPGQPTPH